MKKETLYKIFAIALVAIFIIEMAAIGIMNTARGRTAQEEQSQADQTSFIGSAEDNITLLRYEPYLLLYGNQSQIEKAKKALIERKIATYATTLEDATVINLASAADLAMAYQEIEQYNITAVANAMFSMSEQVAVVGPTGEARKARGSSFKIQISPIYPEGSKLPAIFAAQVEKGVITGIGSVMILPQTQEAEVEAEIEQIKQASIYLEISWKDRNRAKQIAKQKNAVFKEKSYILVDENVTDEQLGKAGQYEYVTAVQKGIISVKNDFFDQERARADLAALNINPTFPYSIISMPNWTESEIASIKEELERQNISYNAASEVKVSVKLPSEIRKDGKSYAFSQRQYEIDAPAVQENQKKMRLLVKFEAAGNKVIRIIEAKPAAEPE
ncbi:MAG: hypothetical protein N3G80_01715 [Candidatus Micrarchaeota archaeon]|nr:hypothetical protein [Candidatus Micrarchaeota archaeon]